MNSIMTAAAIALGMFVFLKVKSSFQKYRAAQNVLLAKYTFNNLDSEKRNEVIERTKGILQQGGVTSADRIDRLDERERYGFYALAMGELGIQPALAGYDWNFVRNPFLALLRAEREIRTAQMQIRNARGIQIDI